MRNGIARPLSVTILAGVYVAVGTIALAANFRAALASPLGGIWLELLELLAVLCGVFMLRAQNWARWGAIAWMGLHVIVSIFHNVRELTIHCLFFAVITWLLLRRDAAEYFRGSRGGPM